MDFYHSIVFTVRKNSYLRGSLNPICSKRQIGRSNVIAKSLFMQIGPLKSMITKYNLFSIFSKMRGNGVWNPYKTSSCLLNHALWPCSLYNLYSMLYGNYSIFFSRTRGNVPHINKATERRKYSLQKEKKKNVKHTQ